MGFGGVVGGEVTKGSVDIANVDTVWVADRDHGVVVAVVGGGSGGGTDRKSA